MKRPGTLLFILLLISATGLSQSCDSLIGTTTNSDGVKFFAFKDAVDMVRKDGKTGLGLFACVIDSAVVVIINTKGTGPCVKEGGKIQIEFTDNVKLKLKNLLPDNCDRRMSVYFTRGLNNLDTLEMLKNKQIAKIKVWLNYQTSIVVEVEESKATLVRDRLQCLSGYIGKQPPQDTTARHALVMTTDLIDRADSTKIFMLVEQQPEFEGGFEALLKFIKKNLRIPTGSKNVSGTVYVSFIVGRDGSLQDVKVLRGISADLDAEALRVVKLMPKWKPGKQNGKPVLVRFNLPIKFSRNNF
jgi:TonB family protein